MIKWCPHFLLLFCILIAGCTPTSLSPEQAVMRAAASHNGVQGTFVMEVRQIGRNENAFFPDNRLFLDSEDDYRDPRNLCIVVTPALANALTIRFGDTLEHTLLHRRIKVKGTAEKVKIVIAVNGQRTEKYYFQTHLQLMSVDDLSLM